MIVRNAYRGEGAPRPNRPILPIADTSVSVERRLYLWLFAICKAGEPAPSNAAIAERFGFKSDSTSSRLVQFLESTGLIRVERKGGHARRIWIGELQRWTP